MRCSCRRCGTYMIQAEGHLFGCVCPECLNRCRDCMGTNTVLSREAIHAMARNYVPEDASPSAPDLPEFEEPEGAPGPEDWID